MARAALLAIAAAMAGCAAPGPSSMLRPGGIVVPGDQASLIERLAAGNIDDPSSPAWRRWGAGYDQAITQSDRKFQIPR